MKMMRYGNWLNRKQLELFTVLRLIESLTPAVRSVTLWPAFDESLTGIYHEAVRESANLLKRLAAEGATAPETLRLMDRMSFTSTLERARRCLSNGGPPKG